MSSPSVFRVHSGIENAIFLNRSTEVCSKISGYLQKFRTWSKFQDISGQLLKFQELQTTPRPAKYKQTYSNWP